MNPEQPSLTGMARLLMVMLFLAEQREDVLSRGGELRPRARDGHRHARHYRGPRGGDSSADGHAHRQLVHGHVYRGDVLLVAARPPSARAARCGIRGRCVGLGLLVVQELLVLEVLLLGVMLLWLRLVLQTRRPPQLRRGKGTCEASPQFLCYTTGIVSSLWALKTYNFESIGMRLAEYFFATPLNH